MHQPSALATRQQRVMHGMTILSLLTIALMVFLDPIPQSAGYHRFADTRALWGMPNASNILSNLGFILVGVLGLADLRHASPDRYLPGARAAYFLLFASTLLVGLGSGYYHWRPDNSTLIWDRLPMAVAFMALFSIILAEYVSEPLGRRMLWPAIVLGAAAVLYWAFTESQQRGDLRPYALIQFLPMIIIPVVLITLPGTFTHARGYWLLLFCYGLAKVAELLDTPIHNALGVAGGHALKHLLAALGVFLLLRAYRQRQPRNTQTLPRNDKAPRRVP